MKYIIILTFLLSVPFWPFTPIANANPSGTLSAPEGQPPVKQYKKLKSAKPMPITPGSQVIQFKDNIKAEIRPDKSVWWFGVNYKKAIVADGVHELKDGQKITTKGGRLVGKKPHPQVIP
jgi:hypothetical protein